jgi:hypothetical protein
MVDKKKQLVRYIEKISEIPMEEIKELCEKNEILFAGALESDVEWFNRGHFAKAVRNGRINNIGQCRELVFKSSDILDYCIEVRNHNEKVLKQRDEKKRKPQNKYDILIEIKSLLEKLCKIN